MSSSPVTDHTDEYPFETLPDYLALGLRIVFVGINPGLLSVRRGHYFARSTNRFWPGISRSRLSEPIRKALGRDTLVPEDDARLLELGIGFTDVVKRPGPNANEVKPSDYAEWAPRLLQRLTTFAPVIACFHGVTAYRAFARYGLDSPREPAPLGPQDRTLGGTRVFVAPNPSPANAHFRLEDQVAAYDALADFLESLHGRQP